MALVLPQGRRGPTLRIQDVARPARAGSRADVAAPHLRPLTGLRFLAASIVVLGHFAPPGLPFMAADSGGAAVTLFFLLSGFILVYTAPPHLDVRAFYAARLARIYPAYLLGLGLVALPALLGAVPPSAICPEPRAALLPEAAMVQAWSPAASWCLNGPAWSVSCEITFYALFPLLLPVVRRLPQERIGLGLLLAWTTALALPLAFFVLFPGGQSGGLAYRVIHTLPLARVPDFLCGMLLGRLFVTGARLPRPALCALAALASLPLVPAFVFGFGPLQDVMFWPAFGVLLLALAQGESAPARALGTPVLVALGEASYGLYILHWGVWGDLQRLDLASPQAGGWPYFLAYAALMIALALLSLRLLEAPARRRLRQVLAGRQTAPRSLKDSAERVISNPVSAM